MSELKPCPHCGGTAKVAAFYDIKAREWEAAVECQECEAAVWVHEYMDRETAEIYVTEAWNRRVGDEG